MYAGVAEVSVYVSRAAQGQGLGTVLLNALVEGGEAEGFWTIQAGVMADNAGSRALHLKCGFREVGYRERLGHFKDTWHDVILLERRSQVLGGSNLPKKECNKVQETEQV